MDYISAIQNYTPSNIQEAQDKEIILRFLEQFSSNVLTRQNKIAHFTSSAFIVNKTVDKVLFAHHNIMNQWAWLGGHVDGETDFFSVSVREAKEESGIQNIAPISEQIQALDILPICSHIKNDQFVNSHLHLSVAYLFIADEFSTIKNKPDENFAVTWFPTKNFTSEYLQKNDVLLYQKLLEKVKILL